MKQDDLVSGVERAAAWLRTHGAEARVTSLVLLGVALVSGGLAYFQASRTQQAERGLAEALEIWNAPIEAELPAGFERPASVLKDAAEKYKKAAAAFDGVERRFASLPAGRRARYYGALCRLEIGDLNVAQATLNDLASRKEPDALEPALARLALADMLRRAGQVAQAADKYRQLVEDASLPLPRDYALMSLAQLYEEAHKLSEAGATYRRLVDEFPDSVYVAEARRRAEYLKTGVQG